MEYLALVANFALDKGNVECSVELTVVEVILYEFETYAVERECPTTGLTGLCREHIIGTYAQGCTGLVEEHVLGRDFQTFVARTVAKLQCFGHFY